MRILNVTGNKIGYVDPVGMIDQFDDGTILASDNTVDTMTIVLPKGDYVVDNFGENYGMGPRQRPKKFHLNSFLYGIAFAEIVAAILLKVGILYLG